MKLNLILLFVGSISSLFGQKMDTYAVEVGAYDEKVQLNYFSKMENLTVYEVFDVNDIYRYWIDVGDKQGAEKLRQNAIEKGFVNARIIDFAAMKEHCKATCGYTPPKCQQGLLAIRILPKIGMALKGISFLQQQILNERMKTLM